MIWIWSDFSMTVPAFFCCQVACILVLHSFTLSLFLSRDFKCFYCKQFWVLFHGIISYCVTFDELKIICPLTFKESIDRKGCCAIILCRMSACNLSSSLSEQSSTCVILLLCLTNMFFSSLKSIYMDCLIFWKSSFLIWLTWSSIYYLISQATTSWISIAKIVHVDFRSLSTILRYFDGLGNLP